ncbi:MAG TPA: HipA N-terminal domain-containing protein [Bacteroidota bacterium]|nr:HipA N-terminal domain-containing protein [Bacteroidota bacterium]
MRSAAVYMRGVFAGRLVEDENGYHFRYDDAYLQTPGAIPISITLPLRETAFTHPVLFPFFDGLIPEGWLLAVVQEQWKIDARDRMGLLLACCGDCIGAAHVIPEHVDEGGREL